MNLVIDTNVLESGLFFGGKPRILLNMLLNNEVMSFVSDEIVAEYQEIFDRMLQEYKLQDNGITLSQIINKCTLVAPSRKIDVCRDPDDNKFLECAAEARCIYIVSGDKDLLSICQFEDIEIITVSEFFDRYKS